MLLFLLVQLRLQDLKTPCRLECRAPWPAFFRMNPESTNRNDVEDCVNVLTWVTGYIALRTSISVVGAHSAINDVLAETVPVGPTTACTKVLGTMST